MSYRRLQVYFFMAICAIALVLSFLVFRPYLGLMVFSGILAVLMHPVYRWLRDRFRGNASIAAMSTVFLTLILILMPLMFVVGTLVTEAIQLFNTVRQQVDFSDVAGSLAKILGPEQATLLANEAGSALRDVATYVQPFVSSLTSNIAALFANTFAFVLGFILFLMGLYYFLKDGPEFKRQLLDLSPLSDRDDSTIFDRIIEAIRAVAFGQFVVSTIKGVLGGIVFFALGLPAPVFWGTMVALANFIPAVGTALVTVPFVIYLFAVGRFGSGLILAAISMLVIGLVDNFLTPQVMRARIKIHPLLILLSMLGGLGFFGPMGLFFGPIVLSVTLALVDIYKKEFRVAVERIDSE